MKQNVVYLNRFNEVKAYKVEFIYEIGEYADVRDLEANKNKTFKRSNIISVHENFEEAEKEALKIQKSYEIIPRNKTNRSNIDKNLEVCFTGFSKNEKNELISIAKEQNLFVRTEVTKKLGLLVCGTNAGPSKIKQASKMNIPRVSGKDGFLEFLETGEFVD